MSRLAREAQGVKVEVTEGYPRYIHIKSNDYFREAVMRLEFDKAEGLLWALEKVIKAAQRADGTE